MKIDKTKINVTKWKVCRTSGESIRICDSFNDDIPTNPRKTYRAHVAGTVDALRKTYKAIWHMAIA